MVSVHKLILPLAAAYIPCAVAQDSATPVAYNDTTRTEATVAPPRTETRPQLTSEMRGDILMARKQYREAVGPWRQYLPVLDR